MFTYYFNRSIFPDDKRDFEFKESLYFESKWSRKFVCKGQSIGVLKDSRYYPTDQCNIYAPEDGYLHIDLVLRGGGFHYEPNVVFFTITPLQELLDINNTEYAVEIDAFTGNKKILWTKPFDVFSGWGDSKCFHIRSLITLRFTYEECKPTLQFSFSDLYKIRTKDSLSFLFEDKEVITYNIKKVFRVKTSNYYTEFELDNYAIKKFAGTKLISVRVSSKSEPLTLTNNICGSEEFGQELFLKYAQTYVKALVECGYSLKDPVKTDNAIDSPSEACSVYLMVDTTNGFYKIGISNKPEYREHTLQSEKPTIELICSKEYPSRLIAEAIESALHKAYEDKRIRGEWFQLTSKDISDIILTLQ